MDAKTRSADAKRDPRLQITREHGSAFLKAIKLYSSALSAGIHRYHRLRPKRRLNSLAFAPKSDCVVQRKPWASPSQVTINPH